MRDLATRRVVVGAAAGAVVAMIVLLADASWSVAALGFSDVASLVFLVWVWLSIVRLDAEETAAVARAEDASPPAAELVLLAALAASLIAVVFTFAQAGRAESPQRGLLAALAIASIALAWAAVHTVYLLRYARLY